MAALRRDDAAEPEVESVLAAHPDSEQRIPGPPFGKREQNVFRGGKRSYVR